VLDDNAIAVVYAGSMIYGGYDTDNGQFPVKLSSGSVLMLLSSSCVDLVSGAVNPIIAPDLASGENATVIYSNTIGKSGNAGAGTITTLALRGSANSWYVDYAPTNYTPNGVANQYDELYGVTDHLRGIDAKLTSAPLPGTGRVWNATCTTANGTNPKLILFNGNVTPTLGTGDLLVVKFSVATNATAGALSFSMPSVTTASIQAIRPASAAGSISVQGGDITSITPAVFAIENTNPFYMRLINPAPTPAPTAYAYMSRDNAGRSQVADPSAAADIATKGYTDTAIQTAITDIWGEAF
jgi:hypothetical protein